MHSRCHIFCSFYIEMQTRACLQQENTFVNYGFLPGQTKRQQCSERWQPRCFQRGADIFGVNQRNSKAVSCKTSHWLVCTSLIFFWPSFGYISIMVSADFFCTASLFLTSCRVLCGFFYTENKGKGNSTISPTWILPNQVGGAWPDWRPVCASAFGFQFSRFIKSSLKLGRNALQFYNAL